MNSELKIERGTIEDELIRMLRAALNDPPPIAPDTSLVGDLGLASIQVIEYLCEVEDRFDLVIKEDALADAHTISDLAAIVESLVKC
ncbi:MAG: acyl carrier protein [Gammaproteobacteria bacterium]